MRKRESQTEIPPPSPPSSPSIIQKHLKRQIISLQGGFQIISDLNTYHAFVSSLKQPR